MDELALNILDIAYNSIRADASFVRISILDSIKQNIIHIEIEDNGKGMTADTIEKVTDPFYTTRTTRVVGLGVPLFKQNAELTGGSLTIQSQLQVGTRVTAQFIKNHIDTPIMGDIIETMLTLIQADEQIDYEFEYVTDENSFVMKTKEMKEILGDVKITEPEVLLWIKEFMKEGLQK
ncbi:ATP-binding protein [Candidatus Stoquefichus sp. SB1]|uniref:ATP-binding protein n=1 Tax=Candidatus Stoquefichus sp. SB1 TaxID=1658109 RepID=UPI00067E8858|nr:ATP-binding protein [Candidatus Stoquefichus sp. SB1]